MNITGGDTLRESEDTGHNIQVDRRNKSLEAIKEDNDEDCSPLVKAATSLNMTAHQQNHNRFKSEITT